MMTFLPQLTSPSLIGRLCCQFKKEKKKKVFVKSKKKKVIFGK